MGIKKRTCRTLMWPKDYPKNKSLKQVSHREIPIDNNFIWEGCMDLTRDLGTDWSESVLGF